MGELVREENGDLRGIVLAQMMGKTVILNLNMKNPSISMFTYVGDHEIREDFDYPQLNQRFRVDMAHVQEIAQMLIDREDAWTTSTPE